MAMTNTFNVHERMMATWHSKWIHNGCVVWALIALAITDSGVDFPIDDNHWSSVMPMKGSCVCFANVVVVASMPQRMFGLPIVTGVALAKKEREEIMLRAWHIIVNLDEKTHLFL